MKHFIILFMLLTLPTGFASCSPDETELPSQAVPGDDNNNPDNPMSNRLKITIGDASFHVTLEDNATAKAFKIQLPMTAGMLELNGNEKYCNLPSGLPAASVHPGTIRAGDLMLYGSATLVLFYKSFSTSYSYTRLGRVDNVSGLASALGSGSIQVKFELQ